MRRFLMTFLMATLVCAAAQPGPDLFAPLIGRHVYACAEATLYAVDSPTQAPTSWRTRVTPYGFPRLEPLTIVSAHETAEVGGIHVLAVIVKSKDGRLFGAILHAASSSDSLQSILTFSDDHLYTEPPPFLRKNFLYLVQGMLVETGMSMDEVECSIGLPEHMNDFGPAGIQWVYDDGRRMVYFHNGAVTDVQQIN